MGPIQKKKPEDMEELIGNKKSQIEEFTKKVIDTEMALFDLKMRLSSIGEGKVKKANEELRKFRKEKMEEAKKKARKSGKKAIEEYEKSIDSI